MKKWSIVFWVGLFILGLTSVSAGEPRGTAAQAKLLAERAAEYVKANGKDKAVAEFNNPKGQFVKGDLYVLAFDLNGIIVAHPTIPAQVGKNNTNIPDADGKYFRREILEVAKTKGAGWVDYKYLNPKTNQVEAKTSYVKKADELIVICGAYK